MVLPQDPRGCLWRRLSQADSPGLTDFPNLGVSETFDEVRGGAAGGEVEEVEEVKPRGGEVDGVGLRVLLFCRALQQRPCVWGGKVLRNSYGQSTGKHPFGVLVF